MVTGKKDLDVNGTDLGAHATETAGSAGMGVLWTAPGMGALDLYVGWAPNSGGDGLDTADYENTFSVGAVMDAAGMTVGAGYEAATANSATACDPDNTVKATGRDFALEAFGGKLCGDQTLMYIGATMDAADIGFSVGYSNLETDGGDKAVLSIGASTTVSDYDVSIDYRQNTLDYQYNDVQDTQSVVAFGLGTSLGDGVDLGLSFSTSDADIQAMPASTNYYFAEASLTVGF
jgi:flagellar hook-associated protein FlgK